MHGIELSLTIGRVWFTAIASVMPTNKAGNCVDDYVLTTSPALAAECKSTHSVDADTMNLAAA